MVVVVGLHDLDVLVGLDVLEVEVAVVLVEELGGVVRLGTLGTPQSHVRVLLLEKRSNSIRIAMKKILNPDGIPKWHLGGIALWSSVSFVSMLRFLSYSAVILCDNIQKNIEISHA